MTDKESKVFVRFGEAVTIPDGCEVVGTDFVDNGRVLTIRKKDRLPRCRCVDREYLQGHSPLVKLACEKLGPNNVAYLWSTCVDDGPRVRKQTPSQHRNEFAAQVENLKIELEKMTTLLKKYINHIGFHEGIDYLRDFDRDDRFTDDEWAELQRLAKERL